MKTRTPNWFYTQNRFLSGDAWRDRGAGFLVWPALWVQGGLEPALGVRLTRWTVGWGQWRAQCDFGRWEPKDTSGPIDWEAMGIDDYLAWTKKTFGKAWGRVDVERLFRREPAWRDLAQLGTTQNHYVRVLMARVMLAAQDAAVGTALGGPEGGLDTDTASTSQRAWTRGAETAEASQSMMEDLDRLGENIRRGETDSEP